MIDIRSLTRIFPRRAKPALDCVSLTVEPGCVFGLLGPNGAGKTTLARILSTLVLPSAGTATICGYDVVRDARQVRSVIGLTTGGERSFYFRLTGYQNLEFFGGLLGLRGRELAHRVDLLLDLVGLSGARDVLFMRYSTGMKRKLALARCLLSDPPVYLLDEPTTGIDPGSGAHIEDIIRDLRSRGKTILLTTHDMQLADRLSDVVGILNEGRLVAADAPANLRGVLQHRTLVITIGLRSLPVDGEVDRLACTLRHMPMITGVSVSTPDLVLHLDGNAEVTPVVSALSQSGLDIQCIKTQEPTLEDVFLRLTRC